ncbi:MAG: universal stress protein [Salinivirgaceae bacterium]
MKHILVPIDFSSDSINALEHSIMIANKLSMDLMMIHVKRKNADYDPSFNLNDFDEVVRSGVIDNFEQIVHQYQKQLKGVFHYRIREGRIYTEICHQAKYGDAEMIIMGTHGVSGFEEKWVGSNAFRVVSNAICPVLTTRYSFPKRPIKKIVMPIDISKDTRLKVPKTVELALIFGAELHVVDVRDNNKSSTKKILEEYILQIGAYLKRHKVKWVHESIKGKNLTSSIIEHALLMDADLISIMNEQNEKARNIWLGPYAQQMVNHSPVPVLSFQSGGD